jgi:hypothetical protein
MSSEPQVGFRFRLLHPDGRQESLVVDAERALIGSAAHCEVRLAPDLVAHEHVEVYVNDGTVQFATRALGLASGLPTLDGATTGEGLWRSGSVLTLGGVEMSVDVVDMGTAKAKPPFWALLALLPIAILTVTAVVFARPNGNRLPPLPPAPELLPQKAMAVCTNVAADQRVALANEKNRIALAKRERSPFSPQDGFEAVAYFEYAASCYRASSMGPEAQQAEHSADVLREKLDEDYRVRRVRLEHAYHVHDTPAVKRELSVLIPMTSSHRGPYTEFLAALDRAVTAEIEQQGKLY